MNKWIWVVLALAITLAGCNLFNRDFSLNQSDFPDKNTGALVLILDGSNIATKTIAPANMVVDHFELAFGHGTDSFVVPDHPANLPYSSNGFVPGSWTVRVQAKDSANLTIGEIDGVPERTMTFDIEAGEIAGPLTASILPVIGAGNSLSLTLQWPPAVSSPVSMQANLVPAGEVPSAANEITFSITDATQSATYAPATAPASGYYTLFIRLYDSTDALVWGWVESLRMVTGKDTVAVLDLESGIGGLVLNITYDMQNPIAIGWDTTPPTSLELGSDITITAIPNPGTPASGYAYQYQWYLDGASLGAGYQAAAITYGASLGLGDHGLCVVITEQQIAAPNAIRTISSNGFTFSVHN